ncbi:MAG: hypothetical protein SGBAC_006977 [Bacillariaceae sp.]
MEKSEENTKKRKLDETAKGSENGDDTTSKSPPKKQQRADTTGDGAAENGEQEKVNPSGTSTEEAKEEADNDSSSGSEVQDEDAEEKPKRKAGKKSVPTNTTAAKDESVKEDISSASENKADDTVKEDKMDVDNREIFKEAGEKKKEVTKSKKDESENSYNNLRWIVVKNDGRPSSLIKLVALKSLFSKQLPKMPRAYIARLVFDRRHTAIAILNEDPAVKDTDEEVIGSICYRAFPEMRFAEIAFCAVNAAHQVKGYGTKLMNLLKQEGARTGIEYFITYADNYAIGYFKKQGFSKTISMPKGRYQGLIKDYDGGTMMECYVHPSIDFTNLPAILKAQRRYILDRVRLKAKSTTIYDPLPQNFKPNLEGISRANEAAARAMAIPGILEAGWTMADLLAATGQGKDVDRAKTVLKSELLAIVRKVEEQQFSWPFREPVDTSEVKDYLEVIKVPIDLQTIEKRTRMGDHYKSKQMLYADLMLMVNNCKLYNEPGSTYVNCASSLEKYLGNVFRDSK